MRRLPLLGLLVLLSMSLFAAVIWAARTEVANLEQPDRSALAGSQAIPTPAGHWECWDDGSLDPCHRDQVAIQVLAEDDIWIGSRGDVAAGMRLYNGSVSQEIYLPNPPWPVYDLRDLDMDSPSFGLAIGSYNSWRWDGRQWHTELIDHGWSYMQLNSVDILEPDDAWAAGSGRLDGVNYGSVAHWDANRWTVYTVTEQLTGLSMIASDDAWAVGDKGAAYHWDGLNWTDKSWPVESYLSDVGALPGGKAWAVGELGSLAYYDGAAWITETLTTTADFYAIHMKGPETGWIVGSKGMVLHYSDQKWTEMPVPADTTLKAVDVLPDGRAYALGLEGDLYSKLGDTPWTTLYEAPFREWLYDVAMLSPDYGWVVGDKGRAQEWDGITWSPAPIPNNRALYGLDLVSAADGWAVGQFGSIFHWDGHAWNTTPVVTSTLLTDVDLISPTLGFAVGDNGAILQFSGTLWQEYASPTDVDLLALEMVSPVDGWAVGGEYRSGYVDVILHWDGLAWTHAEDEGTFNCTFNGVSVVDSDSIYLSSNNGLYHFDGLTWSKDANHRAGVLSSVAMLSDQEGWVTGRAGVISHWDGRGWESIFDSTGLIDTAQVLSHDEAWAVTGKYANGAILQYTAPAQQSADLVPGTLLKQNYPGHETAITPLGTGNIFTITYKLRPYGQSIYRGVDHFFELDAAQMPFSAELTIVIDDPETYGALGPFLDLYRLVDNRWVEDDITLLSYSYDPQAPVALKLEYRVTNAGSYGLLMKTPDVHVYLPVIIR